MAALQWWTNGTGWVQSTTAPAAGWHVSATGPPSQGGGSTPQGEQPEFTPGGGYATPASGAPEGATLIAAGPAAGQYLVPTGVGTWGVFTAEQLGITEGPQYPGPGGTQQEFNLFYQQSYQDPMGWQNWIYDTLKWDLSHIASAQGVNPNEYYGMLDQFSGDLYSYLDTQFINPLRELGLANPDRTDPILDESGRTVYTNSSVGLTLLLGAARGWLSARSYQIQMGYETMGSSRSTGSGSGAVGPTFDTDYLADQVLQYWRAYLREEPPDARGVAQAYVNASMANPTVSLDFATFVKNYMRTTARWASLYNFKPEGMDELEYQQPYLQAANQLLRPDEAISVAVGGMQLGSDQNTFAANLYHQPTVTKSAPFISNLEQTLRGMRGVLG